MHEPIIGAALFFAIVTVAIGVGMIISAADAVKRRRRIAVTTVLGISWIGVFAAVALAGPQVFGTIFVIAFVGLCLFGWAVGGGRG